MQREPRAPPPLPRNDSAAHRDNGNMNDNERARAHRPRPPEPAAADDDDDDGVALVPEHMRLQDLDGWLQLHGLPSHVDTPRYDLQQEQLRVAQEEAYQRLIHNVAFAEAIAQEEQDEKHKQALLERIPVSQALVITTADSSTLEVTLRPMAACCDTILAMVRNSSTLHRVTAPTADDGPLSMDLSDYSTAAVKAFVGIIFDDDHLDVIHDAVLVDCLRLAHYLQHVTLLDDLTAVLVQAVDTSNCLSLCQLADQLQLPSLFERSISHMIKSMDELQNVLDNDDDNNAEQLLTDELRSRIGCIQVAISSSFHNGSHLSFASLEEYLALFAERVQYYRERLAQATEELQDNGDNVTDTIFRRRAMSEQARQYTQQRIQQQARKVQTLELALAEQKKLFGSQRQHF